MLLYFIAGAVLAIFIIDWLIVLGPNPKKWKGGKKKR